jgi:hypothetical protein
MEIYDTVTTCPTATSYCFSTDLCRLASLPGLHRNRSHPPCTPFLSNTKTKFFCLSRKTDATRIFFGAGLPGSFKKCPSVEYDKSHYLSRISAAPLMTLSWLFFLVLTEISVRVEYRKFRYLSRITLLPQTMLSWLVFLSLTEISCRLLKVRYLPRLLLFHG